jgi:hypothetical protein
VNGKLAIAQHRVCACDNVTFKVTQLIKNNKEKNIANVKKKCSAFLHKISAKENYLTAKNYCAACIKLRGFYSRSDLYKDSSRVG